MHSTGVRHTLCRSLVIAMISLAIEASWTSAQSLPRPTPPGAPTGRSPAEPRTPDDPGPGRGRDSAEIRLAEIRVAEAAVALEESSWWRRCLPRVNLSASFGMSEVLFPDPGVPSILPRDTYRLTLALPIHELLDFSRERQARLKLEESRLRLAELRMSHAVEKSSADRRSAAALAELILLREEEELVRRLVRYYEVQFEQGEVRFDTLLRARLQLLNTRARILRCESGGDAELSQQ
jgi:outer membrane protein TolC